MEDTHYNSLREAGILEPVDIHFAALMEKLTGGANQDLRLAAALTSSATGQGHICLDLSKVAGRELLEADEETESFLCPRLDPWCEGLRRSPVVGMPGDFRPMILDGGNRLYLYRYWEYEETLASWIRGKVCEKAEAMESKDLREGLDRLFPGDGSGGVNRQKVAAFVALNRKFCIISGGPGTGKTTTVSKILALLLQRHGPEGIRIALVAPTGKGAARLEEAIRATKGRLDIVEPVKRAIPETASTIHRLLGSLRGSPYFRHHAGNPLPHDLIVVDEASMVDLALLSKLVQAVSTGARLILLGDKDQLASVEAGAVLGDICDRGRTHGFSRAFSLEVEKATGWRPGIKAGGADEGGMEESIVDLRRSYRFGPESGIHAVSRAVNEGDGERAMDLLKGGRFGDIAWHDISGYDGLPGEVGKSILEGFRDYLLTMNPGEIFQAFDRFRILCALREGPFGVKTVNAAVERMLRRAGLVSKERREWYPGRPVLITRNDYGLGLYNGDTGIVLPDPERKNELRVFFPGSGESIRKLHPLRLPEHETVYAMTVHKSQGSEFDRVLFLLPDRDTPLLTRELIYTGMTRARKKVDLWVPEKVFKEAVSRRIERTSGLRDALWGRGVA